MIGEIGERREVRIIGFQGNPRLREEHPLIQLGHVGVSLDVGHTIYGFHPSIQAVTALRAQGYNVLKLLRERSAILGEVSNDTAIFRRAAALGDRTTVYQLRIGVSARRYMQIQSQLEAQLANKPIIQWYSLPSNSSSMPLQCNNCATWPRTLGLAIPEHTGFLELYIAALPEVW